MAFPQIIYYNDIMKNKAHPKSLIKVKCVLCGKTARTTGSAYFAYPSHTKRYICMTKANERYQWKCYGGFGCSKQKTEKEEIE